VIERVMVANRGEIARRVFRSCRDQGIGTVAVYSDADAGALHVREADVAVRLPGRAPADTYLRGDLLVQAAQKAGADAVHPGYGFLSESAGFARAVIETGLTWIGPPPDAIDAMGSKIAAKKLMADAGVPVLAELDPELITEDDLPVLVKASAGGGGRGMRVVRERAELGDALAAARAEAASSFGDDTVFCEPYLANGRHIEVQVLADGHGTVWAVGERECSIQRRHQKVIEEAPSPMVDDPMRRRLGDAAVAAARAIGYVGAGTVEFMAGADGRFFFLEMNTRLQVEHPVTECVSGLDLVALQLEIAEGGRLAGEPPPMSGHAIEARLYAEDPAAGWRPQSGVLHGFAVPGVDAEFAVPPGHGLRLDSAVGDGDAVGVHYDPMLAKVIAWAPTRERAARRLAAALAGASIHGLTTNRDLLVRVLRHPSFLAGDIDTGFLDGHSLDRHRLETLAEPLADERAERLSALAAALADAEHNRAAAPVLGGLPAGWRNVASKAQHKAYAGRAGAIDVEYRMTRDGPRVEGHTDVRVVDAAPDEVVLDVAGLRTAFRVARHPGLVCVDSALGPVTLTPLDRFGEPAADVAAGSLLAPMPGVVTAVHVTPGQAVRAGQPLLALEAMKMQHTVAAPGAGVVRSVAVEVGAQVEGGAVLAVLAGEEAQ
jgi:propionyl-CoA carboxylase alpha chain